MTIARYSHACDASAAATIDGTTCFAAASDEESVLRVYDFATGGAPIAMCDIATFLELDEPDKPEADIEGAAQIGARMYWIGSHGRNKNGKVKKNRQRLFATTIERTGGAVTLQPAGKPYKRLLADLSEAPALEEFGLAAAAAAEQSPEKPGGFNIEGLAPAREPWQLLIGFRNPVPKGSALIVRLKNPAALVDGTVARAELEPGGVLDLQGLGIRALEFSPGLDRYLILAGAFDDAGGFQLYEWSGHAGSPARTIPADLSDLKPEELLIVESSPGEAVLQFLSDDGTEECKAAAEAQRSFRARTVRLRF